MATDVTNITETLSSLLDDIYFLVGESDDTFPQSNVTKILNDALNKVWRAAHRNQEIVYAELDAEVFGVDIPDPVMYEGSALVNGVWVDEADGSQTYISPQEFANEDGSREQGKPETFAVRGKTLYLYPTPDQPYTITVAYRREAPRLVNPSDEVDMQDMELSAAKYYVAYVLKVQDEEYDSADRFKAMFDSAIADLIVQEAGVYPAGSMYSGPHAGGSVL